MAEPIITVPESESQAAARAVLASVERLHPSETAHVARLIAHQPAVAALLLERGVVDFEVEVVISDPRRARVPLIRVAMALVDADIEDEIERAWPNIDFEFELRDPEDCP